MMHAVCCQDVQDRLEEFHDGELSVEERVAIQGHLQDCVTCGLAATELQEVGSALRDMAKRLPSHTVPDADRISRRVTERLRVEALFSFTAELKALFQDMHLVWAALGATAATVVCLIGSLSVLHAANQERPDSLAGLISYLASPGSNENPVRLHDYMMVPRARTDVDAFLPMSDADAVLALAAVVTREGRVQNLEYLGSDRPRARRVRPDVLGAMLDAAARAEFEPALSGGEPVAVTMVWVLASTTVKGQPEDVMLVRRRVDAPPRPPIDPPKPAPAARPSTEDALPFPAGL
jgi:hypothetical protein